MSRRLLASLVAAWTALAILAPAFGAEPVFPPGSRIGLEPPGDLKPSNRFPGFEDFDRKVAITILDLPAGAEPELVRAAESRILLSLNGVKREDFSFRSGAGKLISADAQGRDFKLHRWILVATADKDLSVLISVEVPDAAYAVYSDAVIRKALSTVTVRPPPIQEQLGMMPFKVGDLAGFRVMKVLPAGGVILIDGPTDDLGMQPYVVVSIGRGSPEQPDDRARFARDLLSASPLRELMMQSGEEMRIGRLPGYEIRAQAKALNGDPLALVQWLRFTGTGFLRVVGVGRKADWDELFPRFRTVRDGIGAR